MEKLDLEEVVSAAETDPWLSRKSIDSDYQQEE